MNFRLFVFAVLCAMALGARANPAGHVLLISVDGLHALDLRNYIASHPDSAMAGLAGKGIEYTDAQGPVPADSFPGLLAIFTGGTPAITGVYFDVSYARDLSPPLGPCRKTGTSIVYDESMDGADGKIDRKRLPLDPVGCRPVYPHAYLKVNTAFEAIRNAGGYTAWIDKHPVYEILNGPDGQGVDDLYTPEIGENSEGKSAGITSSLLATERYDELKVDALLEEMDGRSHDGKHTAPVPSLFGLNLQELNVAQKLYGYEDGQGKPSKGVDQALRNCDRLIGRMVSELKKRKLLDSTLFILTAKHGNGPIDGGRLRHVDEKAIADAMPSGMAAKITSDRSALIWLKDRSKTEQAADILSARQEKLGIERILSGNSLLLLFPADSRSPDIVLIPENGVIYSSRGDDKRMEHGGFDADDTHVALLVSNPSMKPGLKRAPVFTTQIAPTILDSLGIPTSMLDAVRIQGTRSLPGMDWKGLFSSR